MKCPKCGLEAQINRSKTEVTGDNSPDTETKIFTVLTFVCRNPQCGEHQKQIGEVRHQIYPEVSGGAG